jgi:large subunit ribosomal protein L25
MTTVAGRLLFHRLQKPLLRQRLLRSLSTLDPLSDPAKFISGLTSEDVEKNEEIAAFIAANFEPPPGPDEPSPWSVKSDEAKVEKESQPDAAEHLNIRKIHCFLRDPAEEEGSRRCQDLRASRNQIPGLLYGGNPDLGISSRDSASKIFVKTPWNVLHREFDLFHRAVESRVYDLTVYQDEYDTLGTVHRVLPTDVQWHPIRRTLFCINYLRYHPLRPIKIPIVYVNEEESPVMKRGGFIAPVNRYVSCLVEEGVPIPERLELECAGLKLKEVVRLDRIIFPEGVRMSKRGKPEKFVIGTVFGSRGDKDDDEAQEKETKVAAAKKA